MPPYRLALFIDNGEQCGPNEVMSRKNILVTA